MVNTAEIEFLAKDEVTKVLKNIESNTKKWSSSSVTEQNKVSTSGSLLTGVMQGLGIASVLSLSNMVGAVKDFAIDSVKSFLDAERAAIQFESTVGDTSSELLAALQDASDGMVSLASLTQASLRAMALGIDESNLVDLMSVASARAKIMGTTTTSAFNDITTGIGRQSKLILDNLGIIVDLADAYDDYAETLGITSNELTEMDKKQAIVNQIINESTGLLLAQAFQSDDTKSSIERLSAAYDDFKVKAGEALVAVADGWRDNMDAGKDAEEIFQELDLGASIPETIDSLDDMKDALNSIREIAELVGGDFESEFNAIGDAVQQTNSELSAAVDNLDSLKNSLSGLFVEKSFEELEADLLVKQIEEQIAAVEKLKAAEPFRTDELRAMEVELESLNEELDTARLAMEALGSSRDRLIAEEALRQAEITGVPDVLLAADEGEGLTSVETTIDETISKIALAEQEIADLNTEMNSLAGNALALRNNVTDQEIIDAIKDWQTEIIAANREAAGLGPTLDESIARHLGTFDELSNSTGEVASNLSSTADALERINESSNILGKVTNITV